MRKINSQCQYDPEDCEHTFVPIEWICGKRTWEGNTCYIDWTANYINSHVVRVTKLYCPLCGVQFKVPSDATDKQEDICIVLDVN